MLQMQMTKCHLQKSVCHFLQRQVECTPALLLDVHQGCNGILYQEQLKMVRPYLEPDQYLQTLFVSQKFYIFTKEDLTTESGAAFAGK